MEDQIEQSKLKKEYKEPKITISKVYTKRGDAGLTDLDDTVQIAIQANLIDTYEYPVNGGTVVLNAPGGIISSVCDPADTDNDGFIGCCDSFDVIGGTGSGSGDGVCDIVSEFESCSDCVANGGTWVPDAAQDDPNIFGTQINGPNDFGDNTAYGKTNGDGSILWLLRYDEVLNTGDGEDPETYDDFTSGVYGSLIDPLTTTSNVIDITLEKSESNDNPD